MACVSWLRLAVVLLAFSGQIAVVAHAGEEQLPRQKLKAPTTGRLVYREQSRRTLTIYYPPDWKPTDKRSALLIFRCHIPVQREHFRKLGMVVIEPQTAAVNSGQLPRMTLAEIAESPQPREQVQDTKSAIRYVRANGAKLGIDPARIVATGTSGGGDLALLSCLNTTFEHASDDRSVSPRPNALVLYCPAFDGIDIWFVKMETLLERTKAEAPAFLPHLSRFIRNTTDPYATPLDHRSALLELAATVGEEQKISDAEIAKFREIVGLFNERDWQLLHPFQDALQMSASRILTKEPLPPTLIMLGDRDHLRIHQEAFLAKAKSLGQEFDLKVFKGGGHSFMMQPAFQDPSTQEAERFLRNINFVR